MSESRPYHHGNLRQALLDEAVKVIAEQGVSSFSLRDLARRLGVSHAAPAHHFAEKRDLLTAIAVQGYEMLGEALSSAASGGFLEAGLAYVRFAVEHPVHLGLMFDPSLLRVDDEALRTASARTSEMLYGSAGTMAPDNRQLVGLAGWCLMHGFANLWLSGNLRAVADEPIDAAKRIAEMTFREPG
jgi:AcrR family transcriptional regulator